MTKPFRKIQALVCIRGWGAGLLGTGQTKGDRSGLSEGMEMWGPQLVKGLPCFRVWSPVGGP